MAAAWGALRASSTTPRASIPHPAELAAEKRTLAERQADVARLESAAATLPAEVDTARAKEEAAELQHAGAQHGA